jgi:hypothetical protein
MSARKNNHLQSSAKATKPAEVPGPLQSMKFFGIDYFRVIYVTVAVLLVLMTIIYFSTDDPQM